MLKPINRLTKKREFDRIFREGRSSFDRIIGLRVLKNDGEGKRFGIIVSAKVSKRAVERNLIKRRIRAALRQEENKLKTGNDFLIIALPPILEKKYHEIEFSLRRHCQKLHLYKTGSTLKQNR